MQSQKEVILSCPVTESATAAAPEAKSVLEVEGVPEADGVPQVDLRDPEVMVPVSRR